MNPKPAPQQIPLAEALRWRGGGRYRFEEKLDGRFALREFEGARIAGELMPNGEFYAFDILQSAGVPCAQLPLSERLSLLDNFLILHSSFRLRRPAHGSGGEFLEHILAAGGEGIVAKPLDTPYGCGWLKAKREETFYVRVLAAPGCCQSVPFEETDESIAARLQTNPLAKMASGRCPLFGGKAERVRAGSLLKLTGYGVTARGKIREPRPDRDTPASWLVQY